MRTCVFPANERYRSIENELRPKIKRKERKKEEQKRKNEKMSQRKDDVERKRKI